MKQEAIDKQDSRQGQRQDRFGSAARELSLSLDDSRDGAGGWLVTWRGAHYNGEVGPVPAPRDGVNRTERGHEKEPCGGSSRGRSIAGDESSGRIGSGCDVDIPWGGVGQRAGAARNCDGRGTPASGGVTQVPPTEEKPNPLKHRLTDKQKAQQQKSLKEELKGVYKTWLDQDVAWIITDTERQAFKQLSNDEERDAFIENFWQRRNPNPDSLDNEYKDEIYARIAYANEHFPAGKPGWMTDRGHVYIAYGKPDDIDAHPSAGTYDRPMSEGGGSTVAYPFEIWHYRYLEGIGDNIDLEFVDTCQCGDYHYTIDRSEKDALKNTPNVGLTLSEERGESEKKDHTRAGSSNWGWPPAWRRRSRTSSSTGWTWRPRSWPRRRSSSRTWKSSWRTPRS